MESIASQEMNNVSTDINQLSTQNQFNSSGINLLDKESLILKIQNNNEEEIQKEFFKIHDYFNLYNFIFDSKTIIDNYITYSFKNKNQYKFFDNLLKIFNFDMHFVNHSTAINFLHHIVRIDKGQYLFKYFQYKDIISSMNNEEKMDLYFRVGVSGTLPTFLLIDKEMSEKGITDFYQKSILSAACRNADDRILKYIIKNFNIYHLTTWNTEKFVKNLISNLFSNHVPTKYILRRIKLVNSKINLIPYFNNMIPYINDLETFSTLCKYYMTSTFELNINNVYNLMDLISDVDNEEIILTSINCIISNLNYLDKNMFMLNVFSRHGTFYGVDVSSFISNSWESNNVINEIYNLIFNTPVEEINSKINVKDLSIIFKYFKPDITNYCLYSTKYFRHLIFMLPYIDYYPFDSKRLNIKSIEVMIKLNLIKFHIKVWLRKNCKIIELSNRIKNYKKINESTINVKDNIQQQKFTKLPPRHILPYELDTISKNKNGYYLLREKADGFLVDFISNDTVPYIEEYNKNIIKAEFIEELDLYLIFDIKKDDLSIIERYSYLRKLHPITTNHSELKNVNSFEDFKQAVLEERNLFKKFLDQPYKNYRIYPKAAWIVNDNSINSQLISNIIEENDYKLICEDGPFKNDGLIISPLDGNRELKLKPKSFHTLDLLFNGKNWIDREKNIWNKIINTTDAFPPNTIWRCYPTMEEKNGFYQFEPREYRFDKAKPNKNIVTNIIYNLHKINWIESIETGNNFYYQKEGFVKSFDWKDIVKIQNNHLERILECVEPVIKSSWLDLGCGSGKLINFIKKYHFTEYVGLDFDIFQLLKGISRIDKNQNFLNSSRLIPVNLKDNWYSHQHQWDNLEEGTQFDYIISNFSLTHFYNDNFWSKLDKVSKENSIFIFNIVNNNSIEKWESGNNYLYSEGTDVKYYFEDIHKLMMTERFISDDSMNIIIDKSNWKVTIKITPDGSNLDSKYTWYVLKKK